MKMPGYGCLILKIQLPHVVHYLDVSSIGAGDNLLHGIFPRRLLLLCMVKPENAIYFLILFKSE